jgi:hypothetical protein
MRMIGVADFFAVANDSDSIGRSILRETVARDNRKYGHHHKNGFAHYTLPDHPPKHIDSRPLSPRLARKKWDFNNRFAVASGHPL